MANVSLMLGLELGATRRRQASPPVPVADP
jgi:hypothetical protein